MTLNYPPKGTGETGRAYFRFWKNFNKFLTERGGPLEPRPNSVKQERVWRWGTSGVQLRGIARYRDGNVTVMVWFPRPKGDDKGWFLKLRRDQVELKKALGFKPTWNPNVGARHAGAYVRTSVDLSTSREWPQVYEWMYERLMGFERVFRPLIDGAMPPEPEPEEAPEPLADETEPSAGADAPDDAQAQAEAASDGDAQPEAQPSAGAEAPDDAQAQTETEPPG